MVIVRDVEYPGLSRFRCEYHFSDDRRGLLWKPMRWSSMLSGAAYEVANELGVGFLEKVYERALVLECQRTGLQVDTQVKLPVRYKGDPVGTFILDLLIEDCLIVEIKCCKQLANEHVAQCLNYMKAAKIPYGLLINFGTPRVVWQRLVRSEFTISGRE